MVKVVNLPYLFLNQPFISEETDDRRSSTQRYSIS